LKHHSSNVKDHFLDLGAEPLSEVDFEKLKNCTKRLSRIDDWDFE